MSDLTLIIPAKNERESLPKVLDELEKFKFKKNIILESSDHLTINAIKKYDCNIIYQESKGYGNALKIFWRRLKINVQLTKTLFLQPLPSNMPLREHQTQKIDVWWRFRPYNLFYALYDHASHSSR